jgi:hypothetical protein
LAIVAGFALLVTGEWKTVLLALLLTIVTAVAATPFLGPGWVGDYLNLIRNYDCEQADPVFARCLRPSYMSNLRATLYLNLGFSDVWSCWLAAMSWLSALLAGGLTAWLCRWKPAAVWAFSLLSYLIFSPHVNSSEDLQLFLLLCLGTPLLPDPPLLLGTAIALVIWFSPGNATSDSWKALHFVGLVVKTTLLLAIVWFQSRRFQSRDR